MNRREFILGTVAAVAVAQGVPRTARAAGRCLIRGTIVSADLYEENCHEDVGNGTANVTYFYSADFLVSIAVDAAHIHRVWADAALIYDEAATTEFDHEVRQHMAIEWADWVMCLRMTRFPLLAFGNRIPCIAVEVS